jgi:hypothetical protein
MQGNGRYLERQVLRRCHGGLYDRERRQGVLSQHDFSVTLINHAKIHLRILNPAEPWLRFFILTELENMVE